MPVTVTAAQTVTDDIISDQFGSLWRRESDPTFELINLCHSMKLSDYEIESDDEHQVALDDMDGFGPLTLLMREGKPVGDELPEPAPPRVVEFDWYLNDSKLWEARESLARQLGFMPSEELLEKMGQPFYEVTLRCSLDTETGKVKLLGAKL